MHNYEIDALYKIASEFAERTYTELFDTSIDTNKPETRELLDIIMQAWLSGYNYLRQSDDMQDSVEMIFGFYVNVNL